MRVVRRRDRLVLLLLGFVLSIVAQSRMIRQQMDGTHVDHTKDFHRFSPGVTTAQMQVQQQQQQQQIQPQPSSRQDKRTVNSTTKTALALATRGLSDELASQIIRDFDVMTGCGYFKCFFPSRTDNTTGWLVTRANRYYQSQRRALPVLPFAQQAWEFAQHSSQKYGTLRHIYLQAPFWTGRLSKDNGNALATKFDSDICNRRKSCRLVPRPAHGFVVQRVRRASPGDTVLAKLFVADLQAHSDVTAMNITANNTSRATLTFSPSLEEFWTTAVVDKPAFQRQLQTDLAVTRKVMQEFPNLQVDFQFILTARGEVIHLDLDRMFDADLNPPQWRFKFHKHVLPSLLDLEQRVAAWLTESGVHAGPESNAQPKI